MDFYSMMLAKKLNKESGGDVTIESLVVTENGNYSETGKAYSPVVVNVPQPTFKTKTITSNNTYRAADDNADGYSEVTVNVQPTLETLNATANGTYTPQGDGYSEVTVNVQPTLETLNATENGTYTPQGDGYDEVNVNVPLPENGYLLESASGQVVNITDAAPLYLQECSAEIIAVQEGSGDPSPTNIRPITGQTEVVIEDVGKNLVDVNAQNTDKGYVNGYYLMYDGRLASGFSGFVTEYIKLPRSSSYITLSGLVGVNPSICFYDSENNYISGTKYNNNSTITVQKPTKAVSCRLSVSDDMVNTIQLELGSTATDFEPYKGKTYTIQLGDTIYGAELDVVTGELRVTHGEETITDGANKVGSNSVCFSKTVQANDDAWCISNVDTTVVTASQRIGIKNNSIWWYGGMIKVGVSTIEDFKTWLASNPIEVCYELATPYTIQLTPQQIRLLEGTNNLSCNTGDLNIEYLGKGVN